MAMNDRELESWQADWRDEPPGESPARAIDIAAISRRVRRQTVGLAVQLAVSVALTVGGLAVLGWVAARAANAWDWLLLAGFAALFGLALAFEAGSLRGLWRPAAESTSDFLDLSIRRCRRRLRTLRAGAWLLAGEWLLFLPWIHLRSVEKAGQPGGGAGTYLLGLGLLVALSLACAAASTWLGRRTRRELAALEAMQRGLEGE